MSIFDFKYKKVFTEAEEFEKKLRDKAIENILNTIFGRKKDEKNEKKKKK